MQAWKTKPLLGFGAIETSRKKEFRECAHSPPKQTFTNIISYSKQLWVSSIGTIKRPQHEYNKVFVASSNWDAPIHLFHYDSNFKTTSGYLPIHSTDLI